MNRAFFLEPLEKWAEKFHLFTIAKKLKDKDDVFNPPVWEQIWPPILNQSAENKDAMQRQKES